MERHEKNLYQIIGSCVEGIELPPENRDKSFESVNADSIKGLDNNFKLLVQIYRFNMTRTPVNFERLKNYFKGVMTDSHILHLLNTLDDWGFIHGEYGELGNGRAGYQYFVSSDHVQTARAMYENHVRPNESPIDRVTYVRGLLVEK